MKEELVSVIIPVYNTETYLKKCLDSVLAQTYKNLEIIIVDDGSTDNSCNICREYASKDKRIVYKRIKNGGVSRARNYAIDSCAGKYIVFVDSDDYIDKNMIKTLYLNIKRLDADICMCGLSKVNEKYKLLFKDANNEIKILSNKDFMKNVFDFNYSYGFPVNKLIKKEIIAGIRFNEQIHYMEDFKFVCDIVQKAKRIVYLPEDMYYYLQRKNSSIHKKFDERWLTRVDIQKEIINIYLEQFNDYSKDQFLFDYVMMLLSTYSYLKLKKSELFIDKKKDLRKEVDKYYKKLVNSKNLSFYSKTKLILKHMFPKIYFLLMEYRKT